MRNITKKHCRCRRGVSFIEVISSIIIVAIISGAIIKAGMLMINTAKDATGYTKLRIFATNTIERIQDDLENGEAINTPDYYSENSPSSDINAKVIVSSVGDVFGRETYLVEMEMRIKGTTISANPKAVIREGCSLYAY